VSAPAALEQLITETFLRTLEEAAFAFAEPTADPPPFSGELLEARLAWSGPAAAELTVVVERGFAASLAATLVGEDEPDDSRAGDALGELVNMAAGSLVHELSGGAPCHLGVPRVRALDAAAGQGDLPASAACAVSLLEESGRRIDVALAPVEAR
jgi:hypothetical protein